MTSAWNCPCNSSFSEHRAATQHNLNINENRQKFCNNFPQKNNNIINEKENILVSREKENSKDREKERDEEVVETVEAKVAANKNLAFIYLFIFVCLFRLVSKFSFSYVFSLLPIFSLICGCNIFSKFVHYLWVMVKVGNTYCK